LRSAVTTHTHTTRVWLLPLHGSALPFTYTRCGLRLRYVCGYTTFIYTRTPRFTFTFVVWFHTRWLIRLIYRYTVAFARYHVDLHRLRLHIHTLPHVYVDLPHVCFNVVTVTRTFRFTGLRTHTPHGCWFTVVTFLFTAHRLLHLRWLRFPLHVLRLVAAHLIVTRVHVYHGLRLLRLRSPFVVTRLHTDFTVLVAVTVDWLRWLRSFTLHVYTRFTRLRFTHVYGYRLVTFAVPVGYTHAVTFTCCCVYGYHTRLPFTVYTYVGCLRLVCYFHTRYVYTVTGLHCVAFVGLLHTVYLHVPYARSFVTPRLRLVYGLPHGWLFAVTRLRFTVARSADYTLRYARFTVYVYVCGLPFPHHHCTFGFWFGLPRVYACGCYGWFTFTVWLFTVCVLPFGYAFILPHVCHFCLVTFGFTHIYVYVCLLFYTFTFTGYVPTFLLVTFTGLRVTLRLRLPRLFTLRTFYYGYG